MPPICVRPGCGGIVVDQVHHGNITVDLCDCCIEVFRSWVSGEGEFRHGGWELRMIRENQQALEEIDRLKRRSWLYRAIRGSRSEVSV